MGLAPKSRQSVSGHLISVHGTPLPHACPIKASHGRGNLNTPRLALPDIDDPDPRFPLRAPYAAAKWGVIGFTRTLAMELGENGIRCNAIQPGPVDGERIRQVIDAKARAANIGFDEMQDRVLANASIKRLIPPQQLADLAVFLASPRANTISGQAFAVDGDMQSLA